MSATTSFPCITLHRPWAAWVARGLKPIETRLHDRFKNLAGKWVAVHAGQHFDPAALNLARAYRPIETLLAPGSDWPGIVALARVSLARPLQADDSRRALIDCAAVRRFGLFLLDVHPLPRDPRLQCPGRQGLWRVAIPADLLPVTLSQGAAA